MNKRPRISVLMPTYNNALYLPDAIESILNQTYEDFEFIIIDDHSTDSSPLILDRYGRKDPRIRVIRNQENIGVARALNQGIEIAQSEYVARMDGDDISCHDRFEKQIAYMDSHPEVGVLGAQTVFIDEKGQFSEQAEWEKPTTHNLLVWRLLYSTPICHPSTLIRIRCLRHVGDYDPDYRNEDMHLWTRMAFFTRLANLDDVLLSYRMPPQIHIDRLSFWEPHIQRVGREYAERIAKHHIDAKLIRILFLFQQYNGYLEEDVTLAEVFQVCQMLEEVFHAMKKINLLEPNDMETIEEALFRQIQALISAAFQKRR